MFCFDVHVLLDTATSAYLIKERILKLPNGVTYTISILLTMRKGTLKDNLH